MTAPEWNALDALNAAGFPVGSFTAEQCEVFGRLSTAEVDMLVDLKARLDAVEPEVQAHGAVAGAALF
jgi:hypothetical protein